MRDLCSSRLPKLHIDLGEGEDFPFFRREGGGFRRSPKEYRDRRCDKRSGGDALNIFSSCSNNQILSNNNANLFGPFLFVIRLTRIK